MNQPKFSAFDSEENFEEKTLCVFVLDTSSSMTHNDMITQLNEGVKGFIKEIRNDAKTRQSLEIGIISFASEVNIEVTPRLVDQVYLPELKAFGATLLIPALNAAIKMVEDRKAYYKDAIPYRRPFIVLLTDGKPYPEGQEIDAIGNKIKSYEQEGKFVFLPIGFHEADMELLSKISSRPPKRLDETKFGEFFSWLSNSMQVVSNTNSGSKANFNPTDSWESFTI